jgi:hypothetical protein
VLTPPQMESFTKFLISAGVFLCVAAFVVPALVLHETSVLELKRKELAELTPVARAELERRQRLSRDLGGAAIYLTGGLLIGGLALIAYALPGMRRKEQAEDAFAAASLDKLRAEIRPQTTTEREGELAADTVAAEPPGGDVVVRRPMSPGARAPESVRRAAEVEERVLVRIAAVVPRGRFEVMPNVMLGARPRRLLLDGLLASTVGAAPDIVVEIKWASRSSVLKLAANGVDQLLGLVARYRAHTRRQAVGWLVLVVEDEVEERHLQRVGTLNSEFGGSLAITAIRERDVEALQLPPDLFG